MTETVKMSVLSRLSGVPAATIKYYVNEGLLPEPVRTSRNMAYYDVALVPRIQRIKELQRTHFLPLKVIKEVLDGAALGTPEETVGAAIARATANTASADVRTREELIASGMPEEQLDWLKQAGVVTPLAGPGERYGGDDLELLRVLGASRKAGITPQMLPFGILERYIEALRALVRVELEMFREGVMPRAGERLAEISEAATHLSERLVVLLRRKMLVPVLRDLARSGPAAASSAEKRTASAAHRGKSSARKSPAEAARGVKRGRRTSSRT